MNLVIFHPLQLFQSKEGMELQFYTSTINWLLHKIKMCSATNNKNSTQLFFKRRDIYLINPKYRPTTRLIERVNIKNTASFNLFALPFSSYWVVFLDWLHSWPQEDSQFQTSRKTGGSSIVFLYKSWETLLGATSQTSCHISLVRIEILALSKPIKYNGKSDETTMIGLDLSSSKTHDLIFLRNTEPWTKSGFCLQGWRSMKDGLTGRQPTVFTTAAFLKDVSSGVFWHLLIT